MFRKKTAPPRPSLFGPLLFLASSGLALLLLMLLRGLAFQNPSLADYYSLHIFPTLAAIWAWPANLVPFSMTEIFAVLLAFLLPVLLIRGLVRLIRRKDFRGRRFLRALVMVLALSFLFLALFLIFHGLNYARSPLAEAMKLEVRDRPLEELEQAVRRMGLAASASREGLLEDEEGVLLARPVREIQEGAQEGWDRAASTFPALASRVKVRPKGVFLSPYWSHTRIVGLYMPLLVEANVNTDQPFFMVPASAAHEMSHARGFAREDDTDFAGLLACLCHPDPLWRYSGQISAWKSLGRKLWQEDADLWNQIYHEVLSPAVIRDLEAESAYWKAFETPVADLSEKINDAYLKANRETEGVKSYGGVTDLLLAWLDRPESRDLIP